MVMNRSEPGQKSNGETVSRNRNLSWMSSASDHEYHLRYTGSGELPTSFASRFSLTMPAWTSLAQTSSSQAWNSVDTDLSYS